MRRKPSQQRLTTAVGFLMFFLCLGIGRAETDRQKEHLVGLVQTVRTEGSRLLQQTGQYVEGVRQPIVTVSYNTSGNRTEEIPGQSDLVGLFDGISYGSGKTFYFYDSSGKIIERIVASFDSMLRVRVLYFYDERGRIREAKTESYDGAMSGTTIYTYDEQGRLMSNEGVNGGVTYSYDTQGYLIEERTERGFSVHIYEAQGRRTMTASHDSHDPGLGIEKVETTYDMQGKPVTSLTYYTQKEDWGTQEEKDAEAKRKISLPKGWFYAYEYDAHRNWVKRTDWECVTDEISRKPICKKPSFVVYRTISYYPESENNK